MPGQGCVRTHVVRSIALPHAFDLVRSSAFDLRLACTFDRNLYVQLQISVLKSHGASKLAMAARVTWTSRADEEYVRT
jgi:hypothetical protein